MTFDQAEYEIRCEWGEHGVARLAPISDVAIIVDVFSFSTSVELATRQGAEIIPYRWRDETAAAFAAEHHAELAGSRWEGADYSLSPHSLAHIPAGTRLVLPSPNGATLTLGTGNTPTLAGCLRNARAVAFAAKAYGRRVAIIPAGERWKEDGSLRPAFEDLVGAGAIISHLNGKRSPEARLAAAAFQDTRWNLATRLAQCGSGKELIERGFEQDVALAVELNVSECVPCFADGAYKRREYPLPALS